MSKTRNIIEITASKPTLEGAGVHLRRAFGYYEVPKFDSFLLLDDFHSNNPDDYIAGFPWHPHRGIETVTYMLEGSVEHGDSMGNSGVIQSGDIQWMTAGSGIIHQEMPKQNKGVMWGFQLWVNLPASEKMMDPRYRDVAQDTIPTVDLDNGTSIKVISGSINGIDGPVKDIVVDSEYLDVTVPPHQKFTHMVKQGYTAFAYVIEGSAKFALLEGSMTGPEHLVLYDRDGAISIQTKDSPVRFLLIAGKPLGEPVAWRGPIVMNTHEQLHEAFDEYHKGTFIKHA